MWWILIVILVIIILAIILLYNNLVQLKLKVKNAWAQIDTQLKRRFDLIPNLIDTVKGYMQHEENTLKDITELRNSFANSSSIDDKVDTNNKLNNALKSVFALAEAYPDLKANQNFLSLQQELSNVEDKIAYSRQFYNDTVQMYNTAIMSFPANILASLFGFKEQNFFTLDNETERQNVKIDFSNK